MNVDKWLNIEELVRWEKFREIDRKRVKQRRKYRERLGVKERDR